MPTNYWQGGVGAQSWATTGNWSLAAVPVNGDDVVIRNASSLIETGLAQSAVTLASLTIEDTFTGTIGAATTRLAIGATKWRIEGGITRFNVDFGTVAFVGLVQGSGASADDNLAAIRVDGVHVDNELAITGGDVMVALNTPADAATVGRVDVKGGTVELGAGVTWTTVENNGGGVTLNSVGTTLTTREGTTTTYGVGAITTVNAIGGTTTINHRHGTPGTASITTLNLLGGTVDFGQNPDDVTIANTPLQDGEILTFSASQVTHTNPSIAMNGKTRFSTTAG